MKRETGGTPPLEKAEQDYLLELCRCEWDFLPDTVRIWGETEIPVIKRHHTVYVANVLLPVALANCLFCSGRNIEIFSVTVHGEKKGISRLKTEVCTLAVFKRVSTDFIYLYIFMNQLSVINLLFVDHPSTFIVDLSMSKTRAITSAAIFHVYVSLYHGTVLCYWLLLQHLNIEHL